MKRWSSTCIVTIFVLVWILVGCGGGGSGVGGGSGGGGGSQPFSLMVTPTPLVIVPNSSVTVTVQAAGSGTVSVSLGTLPAGLTTGTSFPLSIPAGGSAPVTFNAAANLATGNFNVNFNGQSGSSTIPLILPVTVQSTAATFFFPFPLFIELGVPIGGSGQMQFSTLANGQATDYDIVLSIAGLPAGTTATITPNVILAGQPTAVTVTASGNAPVARNVTLTLTGTPKAPVAPASVNFLLDVTQPPGSLANNRTDYLSTEGSPFAAVYDDTHHLIFSSNPSWNRVDVISTTTHSIIRRVPVKDPRGIDIALDGSRVWVGSGAQQLYEIDTATFASKRHTLPGLLGPGFFGPASWEDFEVLTLADGTVMLYVSINGGGLPELFIFDPASSAITELKSPNLLGIVQRTGNGKRVYCFPGDSGGNAFYYDVLAKTFSSVFQIGGEPITAAVNFDGSRVVAGLAMFDGNFNFIGAIPGGGVLGGALFDGGTVFGVDGLLYEVSMPGFTPLVLTIDPNTLSLLNVAPAMPMIPVSVELSPPFFMGVPFAVDSSGMVFGSQYYGIAFDDARFTVNFSSLTPGTPTFLQHMSPYSGPLAGGTTSGGFGNSFSLTPDVWYGANRGTARVDSTHTLTITSPSASVPGPVNIKMLFPDGIEVFNPQFFSYGPFIQYSVQSAAGPNGGASGQIAGFGLPTASTGTVTVGGAGATVTSSGGIQSLFGYPFPVNTATFTVPGGAPGFADIKVTTPDGSSTLPQGMFYAQSVFDFSSTDTFTAILYDGKRQQLYLSAGNHIDVFSLASSHFLPPLTPPAQGSVKQLAGMALTPDGSLLLIADLLDGSLAVINPDNPASSSVIPVAPVDTSDPRCTIGALYVASSINNQAFVRNGGLPAIGCGPRGSLYKIDLVAKTSSLVSEGFQCSGNIFSGEFVSASKDGTEVAYDNCILDATNNVIHGTQFNSLNLNTISADGNVAAGMTGNPAAWFFTDSTANILGNVAHPEVFYGGLSFDANSTFFPLLEPKLNDSGSLAFVAFPNLFDIIDVQHGALRLRFSLVQTVSNTASPIAVDSGGRHIYLLTNRGLTIIDLGAALLSIGSMTPSSAASGTQVIVRGSGFNSLTTATMGGQSTVLNFVDENTLTLTVPSLSSGPADVVVKNSDGTTYTLESGFIVP